MITDSGSLIILAHSHCLGSNSSRLEDLNVFKAALLTHCRPVDSNRKHYLQLLLYFKLESHSTSFHWYFWIGIYGHGPEVSSVQFSRSVMSDSLQPHGLQHARLPCPSPTPRAYSNSCPSSQWCHPTISSSVIPFSSHLQSFPASGFFQMSQFFTLGGQSIGVSTLASVLPMNTQDWFPLEWTSWISLLSKGLSRVFSNTTVQKHQFFSSQLSLYSPTLTSIHDYWKKT